MFQIVLQMPDHGSEDIERILQKIKNKVTQKFSMCTFMTCDWEEYYNCKPGPQFEGMCGVCALPDVLWKQVKW